LFTAPDELSPEIDVPQPLTSFSPLGEVTSSEGIKWYLVKTKDGTIGWIKDSRSHEAEKLKAFFKSLNGESLSALSIQTMSPVQRSSSSPVIVPLRMGGSAAFVTVILNQSLQANMLLDTGATYTLVSRRIASGLHLYESSRAVLSTANGPINVPLATLQSVKVGAAEVSNVTVAIHDISPHSGVDGLLGLNFLSRFHTSIDSRQQRLILAPR
jgi:clan AA aspartic protease (TIGR02281 family)